MQSSVALHLNSNRVKFGRTELLVSVTFRKAIFRIPPAGFFVRHSMWRSKLAPASTKEMQNVTTHFFGYSNSAFGEYAGYFCCSRLVSGIGARSLFHAFSILL